MIKGFTLALLFILIGVNAQDYRFQQAVNYTMEIDFDVDKHKFTGNQKLVFTNNSNDALTKVFYHLYFNAFQPGSAMDLRSLLSKDPDPRVGDRISKLSKKEIGYTHVSSLKQDGQPVVYEVSETILEVSLAKPILPGQSTILEMEFESQVPIQIRRSGRNSSEGIAYSMSQWYPKLCNYDEQGWHANPYIGREFYGIWGDFDVKITIDKSYSIGATGYLQNPHFIGHGYSDKPVDHSDVKTLTWHFLAPKVHDFVWGADDNYKHTTRTRANGVVMHFLYEENEKNKGVWEKLPEAMDKAFDFLEKNYGKYTYYQYSFIMGGDGGMEYPMATLITGNRSFGSLVGVSVHELVHSWFHHLLGTNEALYAWMDEGFTSYASNETMKYLEQVGIFPANKNTDNPHATSIKGYINLANSGKEEALSIHADHFISNQAYGISAYGKGEVTLTNLDYILGTEVFKKGMLRYYNEWQYRHPNCNDFIRVMERESGLELDWFKEYWVYTTKTIDYAVDTLKKDGWFDSKVILKRNGLFPMPIEMEVILENGNTEYYYIPLDIMRGGKQFPADKNVIVLQDWKWVNPEYEIELDHRKKKIKSININPTGLLPDVNPDDNFKAINN